MPDTFLRTAGLLMAALVVVATGIRLAGSRWPFSALLLTVHKLVALVATVALGVFTYRAARATPLTGVELAIVVTTGLLAIASFASGGVISASAAAPGWAHRVHRAGTWITAGSMAALFVWIVGRTA